MSVDIMPAVGCAVAADVVPAPRRVSGSCESIAVEGRAPTDRRGRPPAEVLHRRARHRVRVLGENPLAAEVRAILRRSRIGWVGDGAAVSRRIVPTFNVLVAAAQPPTLTARSHHRRGLPHLAVDVAGGGIHIGPVVVPGVTPCLHCVERHRRDDNPWWTGFDPEADWLEALLVPMAAATTAALVLQYVDDAHVVVETVSICAPMAISHREWTFHPGCDCAGPGRAGAPSQRRAWGQSSKPMAKVDSRSCRE